MKKNFLTHLLQASLMCCLAVLFTACDEVFGSEDNPIPAYLSMNTSDVTLKVGESKTRTAIAVSTAIVEYSSSDPAIATVDANGTVTGVDDGEATITATATGYSSKTGEKIYLPDSKSYKVTVGGGSAVPPGPTTLATPLTMEAITAGTIVVNNPQAGMQYSLNGGAKTAVTTTAIDVAIGDKVQFYGNGTTIKSYNGTNIVGGTADIKVYGNIMSLVDETGYETATELTATNTFKALFSGNEKLTDASGLLLPATTLAGACYQNLFQGCTNLAAAPKELPATTLAESCYYLMFKGCTSLTTIPEALLPATTLAGHCYRSMFENCTGLTTVSEKLLPATDMKSNCYAYMFNGCTGLTTLPEKLLPATEMATNCYSSMFCKCTGLTTVPEKLLPAETLANYCYRSMFENCTGLTTAPKLPATEMKTGCYGSMFIGCTSLTTAPKLPATTLVSGCYGSMFENCTGLATAYVKAAYTNSFSECYQMFKGCTATGAVLHTISGNQGSWNSAITSNGWSTWTTANDWTD